MDKLWPWDNPEVEWAWDRADEIITKFNRMKRDVQADDVDLLKMIAEALVEEKRVGYEKGYEAGRDYEHECQRD